MRGNFYYSDRLLKVSAGTRNQRGNSLLKKRGKTYYCFKEV